MARESPAARRAGGFRAASGCAPAADWDSPASVAVRWDRPDDLGSASEGPQIVSARLGRYRASGSRRGGARRRADPMIALRQGASLIILRPALLSVFGTKCDNDVGRLGLMRRQAGRIRIVPVGKIHDLPRLSSLLCRRGRLHDVESVAIEEEGVIAEQSIQLRNRRMVVGDNLGFELAQRALDQSGIQLHRTLLSDCTGPTRRKPFARCASRLEVTNAVVNAVIPRGFTSRT